MCVSLRMEGHMWDESESDKRARLHREHMETTQRLQEEANELARRQADLLETQAYQAAESAHQAYRTQEAVDKLHQTEELRLKEERQHRLEAQQAAVRRAGLPEFSESFRQEWLRLTRLLDLYRSEAARRNAKAKETDAAIEMHKRRPTKSWHFERRSTGSPQTRAPRTRPGLPGKKNALWRRSVGSFYEINSSKSEGRSSLAIACLGGRSLCRTALVVAVSSHQSQRFAATASALFPLLVAARLYKADAIS